MKAKTHLYDTISPRMQQNKQVHSWFNMIPVKPLVPVCLLLIHYFYVVNLLIWQQLL